LTALIAGASGLVGGECLDVLATSGRYDRIVALTRRDLGDRVAPDAIEQYVVDFAHLDAHRDQLRADHVFCTLGTTMKKAGSRERFREVDFTFPTAIATHTRANGARHFSLVSSVGADPDSRFFYSRVKGELERALQDMHWPSLAIFRPSVIGGTRQEVRPLERIAERVLHFAPKAWRPVPARTIAAAMLALALREPAGVEIIESRHIADCAAPPVSDGGPVRAPRT
jgi:uncharacterized protein YbjT (DUF2867 family)